MVEGGGLENRFAGITRNVGSNPTPSASVLSAHAPDIGAICREEGSPRNG